MKIMLDPGAFMPTRAHPTDAGLDLYSTRDYIIKAGQAIVIDTGIHIELPQGHYGEIRSRSGLMCKHNIVAGDGTIDEGYTGSLKVKLFNLNAATDYRIKRGDKISQLVILPIITPELEVVDSLGKTARGNKGFGSTGR